MQGIYALLALTTAASLGVRRYLRFRAASARAEPAHVTPEAADRCVTIVDNRDTPFVVRISYKRRVATVYVTRMQGEEEDTTSQVFRSFRFRRVFIGLDPEERKATEASRANRTSSAAVTEPPGRQQVWWHGGNTVLLDLGKRRYVFIGLVIFAFTPSDDIVDYVSIMGNNAVPYPFAVGTNNTYLMIEDTYIPNHIVKISGVTGNVGPYSVLYSDDLGRWLPGVDPKDKFDSSYKRIHLRTWQRTFPLKDYELLKERQW